jgi:hypothetical protein
MYAMYSFLTLIGDDILITISLCKFQTLAQLAEQVILPQLSAIRYPKFCLDNIQDICYGTGKDSEKRSKRIFLNNDLDNNTQTLFDDLEKDKEGCATLYLIYEYVRKSNFETVSESYISTIPEGKATKGKGKGKGKGHASKKVKTEPTDNKSDVKVRMYALFKHISKLIYIL